MKPMSSQVINDVNFASTEPVIEDEDGSIPLSITELDLLVKQLMREGVDFNEMQLFPDLDGMENDEIRDLGVFEPQAIDQNAVNEQIVPPSPPTTTNSSAIPPDVDPFATRKKAKGVICTDQDERCEIKDANELVLFNQRLELRVKPKLKQRARRENELLKDLRYIRVEQDDAIVIETPDIRPHLYENMTMALRITRLTLSHGCSQSRMVHPCPLWFKDQTMKTHHGSLLMNISNEMMETGRIKIDKLIMEQLRQPQLAVMTQWRLHQPDKFNWDEWVLTNLTNAKRMIEEFELKSSILHFQIILIGVNQCAYTTDLMCETEPIYSYEPNENPSLSLPVSQSKARPLKRAGQSSTKVNRSKPSKKRSN